MIDQQLLGEEGIAPMDLHLNQIILVSERAITYSCMLRKRQTKENSLQRYDLLICSLYRKIHNVQ